MTPALHCSPRRRPHPNPRLHSANESAIIAMGACYSYPISQLGIEGQMTTELYLYQSGDWLVKFRATHVRYGQKVQAKQRGAVRELIMQFGFPSS